MGRGGAEEWEGEGDGQKESEEVEDGTKGCEWNKLEKCGSNSCFQVSTIGCKFRNLVKRSSLRRATSE